MPLKIAAHLSKDCVHYLTESYIHFNWNGGRTGKMTVFTWSMHHALLRKQLQLATMDFKN